MTRSKSNCFTCIFHSEPAVHFRSCSFLWFSAFRTPQNSQNLTNTIRQIEPRTWCWLMYGNVKYILCAAGAPSASRAYGDSHTWKNECGVVVCVSRICLLGAKAPPPYSFLSAGVHRTVRVEGPCVKCVRFSDKKCGSTLDLSAGKTACCEEPS